MSNEVSKEITYNLGVKRKIKTKRGTGTRDQDEIETSVRCEDFEELDEIADDVFESHKEAVKDARSLSQSGEEEV